MFFCKEPGEHPDQRGKWDRGNEFKSCAACCFTFAQTPAGNE